MTLVRCSDIHKSFPLERGALRVSTARVQALNGVSLSVERGRTVGLVGESGCGKTTLGKIILGLVNPDSGHVERSIIRMQAIFQDPYQSLDPKMHIFDILAEPLVLADASRQHIRTEVHEMIKLVGLSTPALTKYPHQFSGGERQRIAIARAVITHPEFIVCDEPVSSLDVTIQLQILNLLKEVQKRYGITYLFISHDLRVVRFMSDTIAVMKEGRIVETGDTQHLWAHPSHPYTKQLLASVLEIYPKK